MTPRNRTPISRRAALLRGAAALGMLGCAGVYAPRARARGLRLGEPAPPAVLATLDGRRIESRTLMGQVVILTFWATWCGPCREELPLLSDYYRRHAARGLAILAFSLDGADQLDAVRKVAQTLAFPAGLLQPDSAPGYGRIWRIPVSFTIGRDGLLRDNGWDDRHPVWTQERLDRVVSPLLG